MESWGRGVGGVWKGGAAELGARDGGGIAKPRVWGGWCHKIADSCIVKAPLRAPPGFRNTSALLIRRSFAR